MWLELVFSSGCGLVLDKMRTSVRGVDLWVGLNAKQAGDGNPQLTVIAMNVLCQMANIKLPLV